jgi:hypothetical protein
LKDFSRWIRRDPKHRSSIAELAAMAMILPGNADTEDRGTTLRDLMEAEKYEVSTEQLATALLDQMREGPVTGPEPLRRGRS